MESVREELNEFLLEFVTRKDEHHHILERVSEILNQYRKSARMMVSHSHCTLLYVMHYGWHYQSWKSWFLAIPKRALSGITGVDHKLFCILHAPISALVQQQSNFYCVRELSL